MSIKLNQTQKQPQPQDLPQHQSLADKLGQVHVGLRQDLEVHRLLFRGRASYVIRDPVSMQCHRANKEEYEIIVNMNPDRTLADTIGFLVTAGKVRADHEESIYEFVLNLHRMAFLQLPISDDKALFRRYQAKQQARAKEKFMAFLFLRIPLINPDYILNKTIHVAKHLFTRKFFYAWLGLMALTAAVVILKRRELLAPLAHTFTGSNLISLWVCLILLKVFHEFGHSYACKVRGGYVPEMGIFLIAGTPCAYVDVTSSWAFPNKWDRIIVGLGGMYFESMIAAMALFVWAFSDSAGLQQLAHNIFILSGFVTVFMNINPLMKFDGYYILSDLIEVPNLRPRSQSYVIVVLKRIFLGIKTKGQDQGFAMKSFLFIFGVASSFYKAFIVLAISALIATKAFLIGMFIAGGYILSVLTRMIKSLSQYLWKSEESAHVRVRAVVISILLFIGTPLLFFGLPL
ncbi:MAG: hypothetical protein IID32_08260, partial [Planctomycetes bacterium]|nr:hypothetical protein [Planctomycetota bacterium]